jgi:opacity protein-like surface antigen
MKKILLLSVVTSTIIMAGGDIIPMEPIVTPTEVLSSSSIVLRIGIDAEGSQNDARTILFDSLGNPCAAGACGKLGIDRDTGWEISLGMEDNVADGKFGTRKMLTYYDFGDALIHNGNLVTQNDNIGIEATYEVYYSLNKYFKPYIGAGVGINKSSVNYEARTGGVFGAITLDREKEEYTPTLHFVAGVSGELFSSFGYYANYKHRFADTSSTVIPFIDNGIPEIKTVNNDGVDGNQFMIGINYTF